MTKCNYRKCPHTLSMIISFISSMQINQADPETIEVHDLGVLQCDNSKIFKCGCCDFQSAHSDNLKAHSRKHTGEMLQCHYCDYTTTLSNTLKAHSCQHTGEILQCQHCEFTTIYSSALRRHSNKHTGTGK